MTPRAIRVLVVALAGFLAVGIAAAVLVFGDGEAPAAHGGDPARCRAVVGAGARACYTREFMPWSRDGTTRDRR